MKCILSDFRRAIAGRWFSAAIFATFASMWLSTGNAAFAFRDAITMNFEPDWKGLFSNALQGQFGMLTLPALSTLPFASHALHELRSGAARSVIFRTGKKAYIAGQIIACVLSAMLVQAVAFGLLVTALSTATPSASGLGIPVEVLRETVPLLFGRLLCAGLWACVGCIAALLTETASAANIAPLCLCYTLMIVGTRFFPAQTVLNPLNWLSHPNWLIPGLLGCSLLTALTLRREVAKYV